MPEATLMKTSIALLAYLSRAVTSRSVRHRLAAERTHSISSSSTIGNPGNTADTTGDPNPAGSVAYAFRMGQFDISEQMIEQGQQCWATWSYQDTRGPDKPATSVTLE